MPAERSSSSSSPCHGPTSHRRSSGPMSLSRILRGPCISPSIRSSAADTPSRCSSTTSSLSSPRTPCAHEGVLTLPGFESFQVPNGEIQTPQGSPNPFITTPSFGTPATPPTTLSYQPTFIDDPMTSPVLDSPTNRGRRALRRHGAVALLVPQTPSASNWPANVLAATGATRTSSDSVGADPSPDNGTPRPPSGAQGEQGALDIPGDGMFARNL